MRELKLFYSAIKSGNLQLLSQTIKNTNFKLSYFMEVRDNEVQILNFNFLPISESIPIYEQYLDKDIAGICWQEYLTDGRFKSFCRYTYKYRGSDHDPIVEKKTQQLILDYFSATKDDIMEIGKYIQEVEKLPESIKIDIYRKSILNF